MIWDICWRASRKRSSGEVAADPAGGQTMSHSTLNNGAQRVLVIDDEAGLRDMLVFGLTDRGYHVVPASSGEEGVEKAKHENFDLMVCDIMMPGKDGVTVLKE